MKVKSKIWIIFVAVIFILLFFENKVEAKSYSIENMDIQATVEQDGSLKIEQKLTYKFNGEYNGIYITVPYNLENIESEEIIKNDKINDSIYNGNNVILKRVALIEKNNEKNFFLEDENFATNGMDEIYTEENLDGLKQIKVYSPSKNITKTFEIDYTINNLCVKHNDIGELYYNFIGGEWEVTIKNLNIDIYLPNNNSEINIWGHGPYNGKSSIIDNTHANFKVTNVRPGQYVASRILFDNSNILNSTKESRIDAKELIFLDEGKILENKENKNKFTNAIIIFAVCLLIYWIILLLVFEKDKKYTMMTIEEDRLFEKYNPMIAGCIQGNRIILARDIIAVILNLIDKKIIILELKHKLFNNENYDYLIKKNVELENTMDEIESYVYTWIFGEQDQVLLQERLQLMPKEKDANKKFKELNKIVEDKLSELGANEAKVPKFLRIFNVFLFILTLIVVYKHIMFNGFNIYDSTSSNMFFIEFVILIICMLPIFMGLIIIPINLIILIRHKINEKIQKITGQKVVTTSISLTIIFGTIIILTYLFLSSKYLIADEILICIAMIILLTDNLMLKNNPRMIEDYSRLNMLKDKIKKYSLLKDRDIEQIVLWDKYLSYSVSFGISNKIINRIKDLNIDDDLIDIICNDEFSKIITNDYNLFYRYSSLDTRFMRAYTEVTNSVFSSISGSDSYDGGFSGGGDFSGGGRWWPVAVEPFSH